METKLKTLKEIETVECDQGGVVEPRNMICNSDDLRQEAIRWINDTSNPEARAIMRNFFNISEEDLKCQ